MSLELLAYVPTAEPDRLQAKAEYIMRAFMMKRSLRWNFETMWQEAAQIYLPEWSNTFSFGYEQYQGQKKSQYQIEAYPSICAHRFAAICNSWITPWTQMWSKIRPAGKDAQYLMKQKGVRQWFDETSETLWAERYKAHSGFLGNQVTNWLTLGVFGNQNMFVEDLRYPGETGLGYSSVAPGHMYYDVSGQGTIQGCFRTIRWTAAQIHARWPDTFPAMLRPALEQKSETKYWIIQYIYPNTDWQPEQFATPAGKRWSSCYISFTGKQILEEGGYRTYPGAHGRYIVAPDEDFGRGPAQIVLGGAKSMQAMKAAYLKQTHRKGDPTLLGPDGGMVDSKFRPGEFVEGGVDAEGHALIVPLAAGDPHAIDEAMQHEMQMQDDGFLTALFQLSLKTAEQPELGVRQMMELLEQRAQLIGPTVGRQMSEYIGGGLCPRELDILSYQGKLSPQPKVLREAEWDQHTEFDNTLTRAFAASEVAALMQMVEMTAQIANTSQDNSVWDAFAFNRAIPEASRKRGMPERWLSTQVEIAQRQKSRAQQAEREQRAKEMPAQAAIEKAHAISAKAATGGNIGGTLSGTAPGGMPTIPGNPPGLPGRPGVGGRPGLSGRAAR